MDPRSAAGDLQEGESWGVGLSFRANSPNLLISPHMGWSSLRARSRLVQTLAGHLQAYVSY